MNVDLNYSKIPDSTIQTIQDYINHGFEPGDFVRAVLENNLKNAYGWADMHNATAMREIVIYLVNEIPFNAWGSKERVNDWLKSKQRITNN